MVEASRRTVVGLALAVAFIVSQHGFAKFHRTLNQCLGIQAISKSRFFEVVKLIGRAHANNLKDLARQKVFSAGQITKWKDTFPAVESAKCACKRHSKTCGCLSDAFIQGARLNHFCCLQQCKSPDDYARPMRSLGGHHCKDEHQWADGKCDFHPSTVCSCG